MILLSSNFNQPSQLKAPLLLVYQRQMLLKEEPLQFLDMVFLPLSSWQCKQIRLFNRTLLHLLQMDSYLHQPTTPQTPLLKQTKVFTLFSHFIFFFCWFPKGGPWVLPDGQIAVSEGTVLVSKNSTQRISVGILLTPQQINFINNVISGQITPPSSPPSSVPGAVPGVPSPSSQPITTPSLPPTTTIPSLSTRIQLSIGIAISMCLALLI